MILEGEAVLRIDGEDHPAPAGTFASIEPPASRTILNRSDAPVTALLIGVQLGRGADQPIDGPRVAGSPSLGRPLAL